MKGNALVVHGGAPTAVLNASLYGVIRQARECGEIGCIYGALGGSAGVLKERFTKLGTAKEEWLEQLLTTPASVIGTSRYCLETEDYDRMAEVIGRNRIRFVFINGGNGSMDACGKLHEACRRKGVEAAVVGIPKTMDNDIAVTDHAPGYGSAARYIAAGTAELCCDVAGLPIHVAVLETMGRDAGWVAAASSLAGDSGIPGPDLIYVPERAFEEERFLADVEGLIRRKGCGVVVASEGLRDASGDPIAEPVMTSGRSVYFGNVAEYLAGLIIKRLGYKARSEKPGILGRACIALQSDTDRREAVEAGREAVRAAVSGKTGVMVGFRRQDLPEYETQTILIPIKDVMLTEKRLPEEFINEEGNGVTQAFQEWCRPLLGGSSPRFVSFCTQEDS